MKLNGIERETFLEHFTFDFENGKVYWKKGRIGVTIGAEAGSITVHGYRSLRLFRVPIFAHRLIYWMYYKIDITGKEIDHRNKDKADNSISNLRLCSRKQNCRNLSPTNNNATGFRNISLHGSNDPKRTTYYHANIKKGGKRVYSKFFPYTPEGLEQAKIAVLNARKKHFGEYSGDN